MENLIKIRAFKDADVALFTKWLYTPHVAMWYHEPTDWITEIEKRNSEFNWVHHFIVECNHEPIGFCQYYEYKNSGETWHGDTDREGTYSIDYLIGDATYLRMGFGKQIIKFLIDKIKLYNNGKRIIVQPEPENTASCKTLLTCDFTFDERNKIFVLELKNSPPLIRPMDKTEVLLLTDFLYEAIFQKENEPCLSRTVLQEPDIWVYIDNFGKKKDDYCLVAEVDGKVVGAVWTRFIKAYGFIDDDTPEIAISVYTEYRGKGIGTKLLKEMIAFLKDKGYRQVSLIVDKDNYAAKLYKDLGFSVALEKDNDYLMRYRVK